MDKGQVIALGTKEELKKMIKEGETIQVDLMELSEEALTEIGKMPHVYSAVYEDNLLTVRCSGGRHNVIRILNYLQEQGVSFGQVYTKLPTLNDIFLEITGKELRD